MNPKPLPPLEHPDDPKTPAKELFGRKTAPVSMEARSIGYYTHGCLAGGVALPINGPTWQVMRLSRNRNWGHPEPDQVPRALRQEGAVDRLARLPGRRHGAAARRPDDHRPLEPSGRARRRHLADADAGPRADPPGARGDVGDQRRHRRLERRATGRLVGEIHRALQDGRRRTPRSSACSPTRRSRRRCAATSKATAPGCTRSARCMDTTTISICASAARRTAPSAKRSRCRRTTKAAARTSTAWFTKRRWSRAEARRRRAADPDVGAAAGLQADPDGAVNPRPRLKQLEQAAELKQRQAERSASRPRSSATRAEMRLTAQPPNGAASRPPSTSGTRCCTGEAPSSTKNVVADATVTKNSAVLTEPTV